jgi:hypothetical protein
MFPTRIFIEHSDHNKGNDHETSNGPTFVSVKIEVVNLQVWGEGENLMGDKIVRSCLLVCLFVCLLVGWLVGFCTQRFYSFTLNFCKCLKERDTGN